MKFTYVDLPQVAEVFGDHVSRVHYHDKMLRFEVQVTRRETPDQGQPTSAVRHPAARIVLTREATMQLYQQLQQIVAQMEQQKDVALLSAAPSTKQ